MVNMLSPWNAVPEGFVLEEYLEKYAGHIVRDPVAYAGCWRMLDALSVSGAPNHADPADSSISANPASLQYSEVRLDLGCGKGISTVARALEEPDVLFIGADVDRVCIAVSAWRAAQAGAKNAVFVLLDDAEPSELSDIFTPGELSVIYLDFSTPHPKGREANLRLTCGERLGVYGNLLAAGGEFRLRTDNHAFFDYSLGQLAMVGFKVCEASRDARSEMPESYETDYERRAVGMGARICALVATPPGEICDSEAGHPVGPPSVGCSNSFLESESSAKERGVCLSDSLYDYLTDEDLDGDGYVPPEMRRAVTAMRRTRRQMRDKGGLR